MYIMIISGNYCDNPWTYGQEEKIWYEIKAFMHIKGTPIGYWDKR